MARLPYPPYEDKFFAAVGKPTINVMKMLSYSSATVEQWGTIGNAQFARLELSKKNREYVILLAAAKFGSSYEWDHHVPLSARFKITDEQREEIQKAGKTKGYFAGYDWTKNQAKFSGAEKVLLQYLEAVIDVGDVDDTLWEEVMDTFSKREIVEIISVQVSASLSHQILHPRN